MVVRELRQNVPAFWHSLDEGTKRLRDGYRRAGVREYWLIDARRDVVRFEILMIAGGEFRRSADAQAPQPSAVLGGRWTLTRERNRAGRFTYTLANLEP